jgi:hypothetical protein
LARAAIRPCACSHRNSHSASCDAGSSGWRTRHLVAGLVPLAGLLEVAGLEIEPPQRVGGSRRASGALGTLLEVVHLLEERRRVRGPPLEGIRSGHRVQRVGLQFRWGLLDRLREVLARVGIAAHEIEHDAGGQVRIGQARLRSQRLLVVRQPVGKVAVGDEPASLLHEGRGIRRLLRRHYRQA